MSCGKCTKKSNKHSPEFKLKNRASALLKVLVLIFTVIGISGAASAYPVTGNSPSHNLQSGAVQNGTVFIENGFSGVVTIKDPLLHKTENVKVKYNIFSSGSGFIVTKNGYIITAFHVIGDSDTLNQKNKLKRMDANDIKKYVQEQALFKYIETKNPELGQKLFKNRPLNEKTMGQVTNESIKNGLVSTKSSNHHIYIKGLGLKGINANSSLNAHLVDVGDSKSDQDIALLKVDTKGKDLPALNVSSENPKINEKISIYGYPGDKMESRIKQGNKSSVQSTDYTPFTSSGRLNMKNPNSSGTVYYKTNAITAEGYSGGPVVDSKNNVKGLLVYGVYNGNGSKNEKSTASLFLPSKYIKDICKKNKVPSA